MFLSLSDFCVKYNTDVIINSMGPDHHTVNYPHYEGHHVTGAYNLPWMYNTSF